MLSRTLAAIRTKQDSTHKGNFAAAQLRCNDLCNSSELRHCIAYREDTSSGTTPYGVKVGMDEP